MRALHDRASAWYEAHGDTDQAIAHAVYAHDPVRTGDLLWASIVAYVTQGRNEIVQGWLAGFSREELAGYAPLALAAAHSFLAAGNAAEARHLAVAAAAAVGPEPEARRAPRSLTAGLAGIEAIVGRSRRRRDGRGGRARLRARAARTARGVRSACSCAAPRCI